uniref:KOW domain-containing protein n=1 Tax=Panagrellus redivivus TaxID=6233 RepID=A0A7E4VC84_PANRE
MYFPMDDLVVVVQREARKTMGIAFGNLELKNAHIALISTPKMGAATTTKELAVTSKNGMGAQELVVHETEKHKLGEGLAPFATQRAPRASGGCAEKAGVVVGVLC